MSVSLRQHTANLSVELLAQGHKVAVFDADPQRSLMAWSSFGDGVLARIAKPIDASNPPAFKRVIEEAKTRHDRIVIDCPPSLADEALAAMAIADLVLIPVLPSALDIMAGRDALRLAQEARQAKGGLLKIGLVPSRMARTRLGADLMVALAAMGETLLPAISSRAIVAESVLSGQSVREAGPKTPSAQEFEAFAAGVERMLTA
jgi:chromosome partitioning protein